MMRSSKRAKRDVPCRTSGHALVVLLIVTTFLAAQSVSAQTRYNTLYQFMHSNPVASENGSGPFGLIFDQAGNLYGPFGQGRYDLGAIFKLTHTADGSWIESGVYDFEQYIDATPIFGKDGNLYGTTYSGGQYLSGSIYELTLAPNGTWINNTLYNFCSLKNCADGGAVRGGLTFDGKGNLYGTTLEGGINGWGIVFELSPSPGGVWTESVLHEFVRTDGAQPASGLIFDAQGNLYGTTTGGGDLNSCGQGCGTVFELMSQPDGSWNEKVLYAFQGGKDGEAPFAGLVFDTSGNLYGTTVQGGGDGRDCHQVGGCGVVFQLVSGGDGSWQENVLHRFTGGYDGSIPYAGVTFDQAGNLYGTTEHGGMLSGCGGGGCGLVYKLTPNLQREWSASVAHLFDDNPGAVPFSGLTLGADGNLYGTTAGDNVTTFGSVFQIIP